MMIDPGRAPDAIRFSFYNILQKTQGIFSVRVSRRARALASTSRSSVGVSRMSRAGVGVRSRLLSPPVSLPHSPCLTLAIDSIPAADAGFRRFALRSDSLRGRRTRTRGTGANREDRKNGIVVNSQRSCAYGFILEIYFRIEKNKKFRLFLMSFCFENLSLLSSATCRTVAFVSPCLLPKSILISRAKF